MTEIQTYYNDIAELQKTNLKKFNDLKEHFVTRPPKFKVSKFETYMLQDIYQYDEKVAQKLERDVTKEFLEEIQIYFDEKRNLRYCIKGETRSGKSYVGLKIGSIVIKHRGRIFNDEITKMVCGNQVEYREKLKNAKFGDFYLVDENFFTRAGMGANIEMTQLTDYNNIIAKQNISVTFITPKKFLDVGATIGLSDYGRDSYNWLSRQLLYKFKDNFPHLIGHVIFDIGVMYRENGCYVYKFTGGCTNSKAVTIDDIPKEILEHTTTIEWEKKDKELITDKSQCPFYNMCNHGMCKYEKKKDSWIESEMKGKLDERTFERYKLALVLILTLEPYYDHVKGIFKYKKVSSKNDIKNNVKLKLHRYTNTKFGSMEFENLIDIMISASSPEFLANMLFEIDDKALLESYTKLEEGGDIVKEYYSITSTANVELEKENENGEGKEN